MSLICRTCLYTNTNLVNVFSHYENNKLISEMLSECTSVETRENDGLPLHICSECLEKLISAWCFRIMTIEADLKLQKTFSKYGPDKEFQNEDYDTVVVKEEIIVKDELSNPLIVEKNESLNTSVTNFNNVVQNYTVTSEKTNTSDLYISDCSNKKTLPPVISQVFYLNNENSVLQKAQQHVNQDPVTEQNMLNSNQNTESLVVNNKNIDKSLWKYQHSSFVNFTDFVQNQLSTDTQLNEENYQEVSALCRKKENLPLDTSNEHSSIVSEPLDVSNHISEKETLDHNYLLVQAISENTQKGTLEAQKKQLEFSQNENNTLFTTIDLPNKVLLKDNNWDSQKVNRESIELEILGDSKKLTHKEKKKLSVLCKICNKIFKFSYYHAIHVHEHTGNLPFKCKICGKGFKTLSRLKIHDVVHSNVRPFTCDVCGKSFKTFNTVQNHKTVHNKLHECNICHVSFGIKSSLELHVKRHKNQKDYMCAMCGKTFVEDGELRSHIKSHLNIKDFLCSLCGKAFRSNSALHNHFKRIHTNERPYVCNRCDRRFKDKGVMERHALIHTGEKPHTCKLCSNSFRQAVALRTHMRTHTGETPFVCKLCPLQFKYKHLLSNHMKVHK